MVASNALIAGAIFRPNDRSSSSASLPETHSVFSAINTTSALCFDKLFVDARQAIDAKRPLQFPLPRHGAEQPERLAAELDRDFAGRFVD